MEQECDYAFKGKFFNGFLGRGYELEIIKPYPKAFLYHLEASSWVTDKYFIKSTINSPCSWIGFFCPSNPKISFIRSSSDFYNGEDEPSSYQSLETGEVIDLDGRRRSTYDCHFQKFTGTNPGVWWYEYEQITEQGDLLTRTYELNCYVKLYS